MAEQKTEAKQPARQGSGAVRAVGWMLGAAVILGTAVIVGMAVMTPEGGVEKAAAVKAPRVCPPVISLPARAVGAPIDDVRNVRPGMNPRDVEETVKCVSEDYEAERGKRSNSVTNAGRQERPVVAYKRGDETLTFAFFGPAGQEQVGGLWRETVFDVGEGPAFSAIEGELIAHYGAPHETRVDPDGARVLSWAYGPTGAPLRVKPREGAMSYMGDMVTYMGAGFVVAACLKNAKSDPNAQPAWDGRCGVTIRAELDPTLSDPAKISRWRMVVTDQQILARRAAPLRATSAPLPQ